MALTGMCFSALYVVNWLLCCCFWTRSPAINSLFTLFRSASPSRSLHLDLLFSFPDSLCSLSSSPPSPPLHRLITLLTVHLIVLPTPPPAPSFPSLFSASVESLRLHGYSDRGLCRGSGLLFWHAARRYCTTCTLRHHPLTVLNHRFWRTKHAKSNS